MLYLYYYLFSICKNMQNDLINGIFFINYATNKMNFRLDDRELKNEPAF